MEFGSNEPPKEKVCIDYIYVDSSKSDLDDRSKWKVLGTSVHLGDAQNVNIHGINGDVLGNLNQYPGLQSFLPNEDVKKIQSKIGPLIKEGNGLALFSLQIICHHLMMIRILCLV